MWSSQDRFHALTQKMMSFVIAIMGDIQKLPHFKNKILSKYQYLIFLIFSVPTGNNNTKNITGKNTISNLVECFHHYQMLSTTTGRENSSEFFRLQYNTIYPVNCCL